MNETQATPNFVESEHLIDGSTYIVHSYYPSKDVMQEMLKRLILSEYERRTKEQI